MIFFILFLFFFLQKMLSLKKLPGVRYLLSELPDATNTQIFADAQPALYAVQGMLHLSNLIVTILN